jgi:hypothetical protein
LFVFIAKKIKYQVLLATLKTVTNFKILPVTLFKELVAAETRLLL